ncbi:MAG: ABC transporter permease [archaeon]|nr:ABC transporter permease [archaeon]
MSPENFIYPFIASMALVISIYSAISFSDNISDEFEKGTGLIMLVQPVPRTTLFAGKFVAAFIPGLILIAIYYLISIMICSSHWHGQFPTTVWMSMMLSIVYLFAALGVCGLISSISSNSSLSLVVSLLLLVVSSFYFANVNLITEPWYVLTYDSKILSDSILNVQTVFDSSMSTYAYHPLLSTSVMMMGIYGTISTAFAMVFFRYKEI